MLWKDYPDTTTPITAQELNRIEQALSAASQKAAQAVTIASAANHDNQIIIDGVTYQASGTTSIIPPYTFVTVTSPVFYAPITFPHPYQPPAGYGFIYHCSHSSGYSYLTVSSHGTDATECRLIQIANNSKVMQKVTWQLVRIS